MRREGGDLGRAAGRPSRRTPAPTPTVTGGGPASATLDIPAEALGRGRRWFQAALKDGRLTRSSAPTARARTASYDIVATKGAAGARLRSASPLFGTTTTATIYLAAACPFS